MQKNCDPNYLLNFSLVVLSCILLSFTSSGWCLDVYQSDTYHYNPAGKIDPFKPLVKVQLPKKRGSSEQLTPLQQYEIDQLKLVGIAGTGNKKIAMLLDKKGRSYVLSPGTLVGQNNGRVAYILDDQIIIEEKRLGDAKRAKINRLTLKLHRYEDKP
jgi:type IV pilus assembly protein PilP